MLYDRTHRKIVWWALGLMVFVTLSIAGRTERLRRAELIRATAAQAAVLEASLKTEIDRAVETHAILQGQIDDLTRRVAELEHKR